MRFISIKVRVTAWFTFMMLIIVACVLTFMLVVSHSVVKNDAERRLIQTLQESSDELDYDNGTLNLDEINFYRSGVYTLIYDEQQNLIAGAGRMAFSGDDQFQNAVTRTVEIEGSEYLVYDLFVRNSDGNVWLRGLISTENTSSAIHTLVVISLFVFPVLLLIAAVGGWFIAKSAFRPVRRITDTAEAITDGSDLTARIGLKRGKDEIHRLAATFDRMLDRLEASFEAEQRFTSDASHELRTPTAVILAECEYAREGGRTETELREALAVVERQAGRMSQLINQLLSITRMDQGARPAALERANLTELTEVVCDELAVADKRGITLEKALEPGVFADIDVGMMTRLVQNLLENAYKYGRENGHIRVALRREGAKAVLSVADDGIGISAEDLPHIWQRFWRADPSRGSTPGAGLGLSMVRQIAEAHGGTATVRSAPGAGSTFTVTLPVG